MKFDDVYDFNVRGGTKLTKTELALYYLHSLYTEPTDLRCAGLDQVEPETPIEYPIYSEETISFTREDVLDYLILEGSKLSRY